ncbi:MAG: alpha/beta hydrolase [Alphaproteobacteria bacterium]
MPATPSKRRFLTAWRWTAVALIAGVAMLSGCADRAGTALQIAQGGELSPETMAAGRFDLRLFTRIDPAASALAIYLEGDGRAWIRRDRLSDDPTPIDPVALRLAAGDPTTSVAYIARPCQFMGGAEARGCAPRYWSGDRYAPEVVEALNEAVEELRRRAGSTPVTLVGYSGGGTLALLLADRMRPGDRVITVAAVVDTDAWTAWHRVTPLAGSLNPIHAYTGSSGVAAVHLVGERDDIVPPALTEAAMARLPAAARPLNRVERIDDFDHACCWAREWPAIIARLR